MLKILTLLFCNFMLEIRNIYKSFGEQKVLQGLNMFFETGKIHTIIGGNGAGKTTLFNLITGFLDPDKGEIILDDLRLDHHSPVTINKKGITRTFQDLRIINSLSVRENILLSFKDNPGEKVLNAFLPERFFKKEYAKFEEQTGKILERIHLKAVENNLADEISYGQQKLLTIGCSLANNATHLLLDEPVAGIDNENFIRISRLIQELKNEGKTIIQIEHRHDFVESLSDGIWFLYDGKALFFENYKSFIANQTVKKGYLN